MLYIHPVFFLFVFFRKDQHLLSSVNCWYLVLNQTRRESRDHATLSDIYTNNVILRLAQISEDVIRLFKKVSKTYRPLFFVSCSYRQKCQSPGTMWMPSFYLLHCVACKVQGATAVRKQLLSTFGFSLGVACWLMVAQRNTVLWALSQRTWC